MGDDGFWIVVMVVSSVWAFVAVVRYIVDGVVRTKAARHEIEREYLAQMMAEIQEIKARLEMREREREHESVPH